MKTTLLIYFIGLALGVLSLIGYIKNIIHLLNCDFEPSYKAEVFYTIGLFSPLGCIIGYIDLGK